MRFKGRETLEAASCDAISLDVLHPGLNLALRAGSVRAARSWRDLPITAELQEGRIEAHLTTHVVAVGHQSPRVIA
jgi:hypothetical protein